MSQEKKKRDYAIDGVNYRDIADSMTMMGFVMNHSSARNYVIRVMRKFAQSLNQKLRLNLGEEHLKSIASTSKFQSAIIEIIRDVIEENKK